MIRTRGLRTEYPEASIRRDDDRLAAWVHEIVAGIESGGLASRGLPLDIRATAFQWQVWRALQEIPSGATRSYAEIAAALGKPRAVRAVANACANNRAALVIPCHRAIRADGALGGYRWGIDRKKKLLAVERAAPASPEPRRAGSR